MTQVGSFKPAYMNKIMQNWHQKGLHTPAEIETGDKPAGKSAPRAAGSTPKASTPAAGGEKERLMRLLNDI